MRSSNQICWGSDCGGDSGVMRKWKCLPGGEEQLSVVAETLGARGQEIPLEGSDSI